MADNDRNDVPEIRRDRPLPEGGQEVERRLHDEDGRDPTARRGDIEPGGSISDADTGADELGRKALTGHGAENKRAQANDKTKPQGGPPLRDKSTQGEED